jgi:cell division protein FtsQ
MTFTSAQQQPTRAPARRHTSRRRMHTIAAGAMTKSSGFSRPWEYLRPKLIASILAFVSVIILFLLFGNDSFYVFKFDIRGNQFVTDGEIEKASGVVGYNIFFIDPRPVERALAKLPEVKAVRVTTQLPNQLTVDVLERQPQIIWQRNTENYWVDSDGVFFKARLNLPQLPVIRDMDQGAISIGQAVQPNAVATFWALRDAMPDCPRMFEWSAARGLAFSDERGWKIYLGDSDGMAGKVATMRALVKQLVAQNAKIKFIDMGKGDPYYQ